jgi:hypothetical protein
MTHFLNDYLFCIYIYVKPHPIFPLMSKNCVFLKLKFTICFVISNGASCPWGKLSVGRNVRGVKCPWGEMSVGRDIRWAKCPWGEMSVGRNVRGAKCPWGEMSWGEMSWGELSWGKLSWGELSWGELSWGELSWGELSWGEWSRNRISRGGRRGRGVGGSILSAGPLRRIDPGYHTEEFTVA